MIEFAKTLFEAWESFKDKSADEEIFSIPGLPVFCQKEFRCKLRFGGIMSLSLQCASAAKKREPIKVNGMPSFLNIRGYLGEVPTCEKGSLI